jgi:hypothetical protein
LVEAAFGPHLDDVAKAFGGHEGGARAASFDQGVGRERRPVDDEVDLAGTNARFLGYIGDSVEYRLFRPCTSNTMSVKVPPISAPRRTPWETLVITGPSWRRKPPRAWRYSA